MSVATDMDDPTVGPKFGRAGKQKIENTRAVSRKRMETFDGELIAELPSKKAPLH